MCRLPLFINRMANFFVKFHSNILTLYFHCLMDFQFFFVFGKHLDVVHVHQVVDLFLLFTEFVSGCAFPKDVTVVASSILYIVMLIVHLPGRLPLLSFFLQLSIPIYWF